MMSMLHTIDCRTIFQITLPSSDKVNLKKVKVIIGDDAKTIYDESMISVQKEKLTYVGVSFGKVIEN